MSRRTTKRRRARGTTTVSKVRVLRSLPPCSSARHNVDAPLRPGELFHTLAKFVSIKTVADSPHREDCRQGALFLKRVLRSFGAEASLVPNPIEGKNPIVVATFRANAPPRPNRFEAPRRKRVLCYGHYDVVPASAPEMWRTDPFVMHGKDGWLYGRGVSDNKGPVLAVAAAAAERRRAQEMEVDSSWSLRARRRRAVRASRRRSARTGCVAFPLSGRSPRLAQKRYSRSLRLYRTSSETST